MFSLVFSQKKWPNFLSNITLSHWTLKFQCFEFMLGELSQVYLLTVNIYVDIIIVIIARNKSVLQDILVTFRLNYKYEIEYNYNFLIPGHV